MKQLITLLILIYLATLSIYATQIKDVKIKIGGDAMVRGYSTKADGATKSQGYAQLFRIKVDAENSDGVAIRTRTVLSGDKWAGDTAENGVSGNSSNSLNGGNPSRLDYAYIEVPLMNQWKARAGRQEANFSDCFNTCDDRRDRLMLYKFYGNYLPALLFDKRNEGDIDKEGDDGDMYAAALFHIHPVHEWALLYATWINDDDSYVLDGVHNFSPYYKYKGKNLTAFFVWNWLGQGTASSWYSGHHNSFATKLEYQFHDHFDISFHGMLSEDGGLVADGYDTYSFVINNDPDNNRSNSRLIRMGGFGSFTGGAADDEHLYISRLRYNNDKLKVALAIGRAREYKSSTEQDLMIYDLQAHYQFSKSTLFRAGIALVREDRHEGASLFQVETRF